MRHFLHLAYNGAPFHGWQYQPNAISVQETIEQALATILRRPTPITGAGRSDSGVNARCMYAAFGTEEPSNDIYALFERELGRTLSSFEYEIINKWIENGITEETIKGALKEAILNNVRNFKYIDKIVYEWSKNGVKKKIKEEKSNNELFDYDWLEDNE